MDLVNFFAWLGPTAGATYTFVLGIAICIAGCCNICNKQKMRQGVQDSQQGADAQDIHLEEVIQRE